MAAPTWAATGALAFGTGDVTVNWPAGHQADDIGLLVVESANQAVALTTPAGFVEVTNSPQGTGTAGGTTSTRLTVFWCRATSGSQASPVITDPGDHAEAYIITFRGCKTSGNPWNTTAGDVLASASTSVSIPGGTTSVADCLVVAIVATGADVSSGRASSWANASLVSCTERGDLYNNTASNGGGISVAEGVKTAAGAYNATTCTLSTSFVQGRMSIALEPDSSSFTGSGALTAAATVAATAALIFSGSAALTVPSPTFSGQGAYQLTGSAALAVPQPALSGSGALQFTSTGALSVTQPALSGTGTQFFNVSASAALTVSPPAFSGSGTITQASVTGSGALTVTAPSIAASGSEIFSGSSAQTVPKPVVSGAGLETFSGAGALAALPAVAGAGQEVFSGSASIAVPRPVLVGGVDAPQGVLAIHYLAVSMPPAHQLSVSFGYRHGDSVMDSYTTSNEDIRTSNDHMRTSDAPQRYR